MSRLVDAYDAALFDLDGVIYLGPKAVPGAVDALAVIQAQSTPVMFVTNNAARPVQVVIDQLNRLGFDADLGNVLTSAQVAATALAAQLPPGSAVLVAGSQNLADLVVAAGLVPVFSADDDPVAVVQGYDPQLSWSQLDEVSLAIQRGSTWYATNDDASRPTDRGLVPGVGGAIAVVRLVVGGDPVTFGKPYRPMMAEAVRRTGATRPIFVGDRLDTDIVGAVDAGMDSLLVFTGAHGKADLIAAQPGFRPTHIGPDLGAMLVEPRTAMPLADSVTCGGQVVRVVDGRAVLDRVPVDRDEQFDALWALAHLCWNHPGIDGGVALDQLDLVG